jgi:hypothetical protein
VLLCAGLSAAAAAQELSFAQGRNHLKSSRRDEGAVELSLEMRLDDYTLASWSWGSVLPAVGVQWTDADSFYGYGGFRLHMPVAGWRFAVHTAAGYYDHGRGVELGGPLQFRSGVDISRRLGRRIHLGVDLYHLSNARIYDWNPGTESLVVRVSFRPHRGVG